MIKVMCDAGSHNARQNTRARYSRSAQAWEQSHDDLLVTGWEMPDPYKAKVSSY